MNEGGDSGTAPDETETQPIGRVCEKSDGPENDAVTGGAPPGPSMPRRKPRA